MYLEAGDGLGATRLAHRLHCHAHAHRALDKLAILRVDEAQITGIHGGGEEVEKVVHLVQHGALQVQAGVQHGQDASDARPVQQEPYYHYYNCIVN